MKKFKLLVLSDHMLSTSGVATQTRWLMDALVKTGKYTVRQLGAAIKHEHNQTIKVNDDLLIKPIEGFGSPDLIKHVLTTEKPDCLFLFTDPRFFNHIFAMHDEIHQICPIAYNHLWDDSGNAPPTFNRVIYDICDLVNCINYPTYQFVNNWIPEKSNYIPHAVPDTLFKKVSNSEINIWRKKLVGENRKDHFLMLYVSRNARRKRSNDVLVSWRLFLDNLEKKHGHRNATLVMHTNPKDHEGPDLIQTMTMLNLEKNLVFSNSLVGFHDMNFLYNACDCLVNISLNEGFGLPVMEAKLAEKPVISIMTGGLTRQIKDHENDFEYGVALKPDLSTLVGNQAVPWIYEDLVTNENVANAYMKIYELPKETREEIGKKAREHVLKHYNFNDLVKNWDDSLTQLITTWSPNKKNWEQKEI